MFARSQTRLVRVLTGNARKTPWPRDATLQCAKPRASARGDTFRRPTRPCLESLPASGPGAGILRLDPLGPAARRPRQKPAAVPGDSDGFPGPLSYGAAAAAPSPCHRDRWLGGRWGGGAGAQLSEQFERNSAGTSTMRVYPDPATALHSPATARRRRGLGPAAGGRARIDSDRARIDSDQGHSFLPDFFLAIFLM